MKPQFSYNILFLSNQTIIHFLCGSIESPRRASDWKSSPTVHRGLYNPRVRFRQQQERPWPLWGPRWESKTRGRWTHRSKKVPLTCLFENRPVVINTLSSTELTLWVYFTALLRRKQRKAERTRKRTTNLTEVLKLRKRCVLVLACVYRGKRPLHVQLQGFITRIHIDYDVI